MNSIESESYDQLHLWLQAFQFLKGQIVIIDGESGAGKSNLAMRLSRDFGATRISLDCYVRAGINGYYADILEDEHLCNDIHRFRKLFPFLIVEGICVQDVLQKYDMTWDAAIYVKKTSESGLWHFMLNLDDFVSGRAGPMKIVEPYLSDYSYHACFMPHEKADFIFVRVSD